MSIEKLTQYLRELGPGLCVAFSGGVDSALLLALACKTVENVHAVTLFTPFHSPREPQEAAEAAQELGAAHQIIRLEELPPEVLCNPVDRCYLCKGWVFRSLWEYAKEQGLAYVLDGTNADDLQQYRPGLRALAELKVKSPLAELGITKAQVREMAAQLGLAVASKPSAPCLATRFPYGATLEPQRLAAVDKLENQIRSLGFAVIRVRIHGDVARLELPADQLADFLPHRETVTRWVKEAGYDYVTLDLEGFRSGSMDIHIRK
ncbi:ATP-dependent sacrificial sulfur transferase LarE [Oscillospiraceae bacterium MB08-C2-2]|nr:ATP-dependent sacrificial sulfur transferase LarE [Oscillospiraceae bacterium MB08-C2-2]